jgi:hypothetical protein
MAATVRGRQLDQLDLEGVFYIEVGSEGFLIVEGCQDTFCRPLRPMELVELGTELIVAGTEAVAQAHARRLGRK